MENSVSPLRVLFKALVLFAAINFLFAATNPPVGKFTLYNWLIPGRVRFPYERIENISKGYNIPLFEDLDASFASHEISNGPKKADEYRVVLIGDSSVWGFDNRSNETLSAKLNELNLKTCDGKNIRFYNLGYPWAYLFKDLLVLEKAKQYQPDMVLWPITMFTLTEADKALGTFLSGPEIAGAKSLQDEYRLKNYTRGLVPESFLERTLVGQRKRLKSLFELQLYGFLWASTGIDHHIQGWAPWKDNLPGNPAYRRFKSPDDWLKIEHTFMLDVLEAGHAIVADAKVVVINEPIYIASGPNSDVRYNLFYPRWAYNRYRGFMKQWMEQRNYNYLDLWNVVPPSEFSDFPFHLYPNGEELLAQKLAPSILKISCGAK